MVYTIDPLRDPRWVNSSAATIPRPSFTARRGLKRCNGRTGTGPSFTRPPRHFRRCRTASCCAKSIAG